MGSLSHSGDLRLHSGALVEFTEDCYSKIFGLFLFTNPLQAQIPYEVESPAGSPRIRAQILYRSESPHPYGPKSPTDPKLNQTSSLLLSGLDESCYDIFLQWRVCNFRLCPRICKKIYMIFHYSLLTPPPKQKIVPSELLKQPSHIEAHHYTFPPSHHTTLGHIKAHHPTYPPQTI